MGRLPAPPEDLKPIAKFLSIADSMEAHKPLVAYQCRMYAATKAVQIYEGNKAAEIMGFVTALFDVIEADKARHAAIGCKDAATVCEAVSSVAQAAFASAVKAEQETRTATPRLQRQYHTAMLLFDVMHDAERPENHDPKTDELRRYALAKATLMLRCLKLGTPLHPEDEPAGGGAGADPDLDAQLDRELASGMGPSVPAAPSAAVEQPVFPEPPKAAPSAPPAPAALPTPAVVPAPAAPPTPAVVPAPAAPPTPAVVPAPTATVPPPVQGGPFTPRGDLTVKEESEASKRCKHTISALQYQDYTTAVRLLKEALDILTVENHGFY